MTFTSSNESTGTAEEKSFLLSPASGPDDTCDAVDMIVLNSLEGAQTEGGPDIVVELMELYLEDAAGKLAAMRERLAESDYRSLARLGHSLRGSSASLGARRMASLCEELERIGEGDPSDIAGALLAKSELESARVRRIFEAECRRRA
jgi:HPt (histidine-containing phosphotransfer) domain-containing protein